MKMIRTMVLCAVLVLAFAGVAFADGQFRMAMNLTSELDQKPTLESVQRSFDDDANFFWGPSWEVMLDRFGFGMHYLVKFDRLNPDLESSLYDWSLDWMGDFYAAFHIFGSRAFFDPFIEVGFGSVGRVDIHDNGGYWVQDEYGEWDYRYEWNPDDGDVSNMSLYPYVGAGLALNLDGLLLGARFSYRPKTLPVPATQFTDYPLTNFQIGLFGGVAIGWR